MTFARLFTGFDRAKIFLLVVQIFTKVETGYFLREDF